MSAHNTGDTHGSTGQLVQVFRSPREEGLYLYVDRAEGLVRVPTELLTRFGKPESALLLMLSVTSTLARAHPETVLTAIRDQGFYLQLPPLPDAEMQRVRFNNTRLPSH